MTSLPSVPWPARMSARSFAALVQASSRRVLRQSREAAADRGRARSAQSGSGVPRGRGRDVDDRLAEQTERSDRGHRVGRDERPHVLRDLERDLDRARRRTRRDCTVPTSLPLRRTTAPVLRPCDVVELRLERIALPEEPALAADGDDERRRPAPPRRCRRCRASARDQAIDRVRGMTDSLRDATTGTRADTRPSTARSSSRRALERDRAVLQHQELRLRGAVRRRGLERAPRRLAATASCVAM